MKFCSVGIPNLEIESEQTYMSDALLKDTHHAWENQ